MKRSNVSNKIIAIEAILPVIPEQRERVITNPRTYRGVLLDLFDDHSTRTEPSEYIPILELTRGRSKMLVLQHFKTDQFIAVGTTPDMVYVTRPTPHREYAIRRMELTLRTNH